VERQERDDIKYMIIIHPSMPHPAICGVEYVEADLSRGINRIMFDLGGWRKFVNEEWQQPDIVFSLQNTGIRCGSTPQIVYYHQSLPFYKYHVSPLNADGRSYLFYHYLYPLYVRYLYTKSTKFIVQTDYIRQCFVRHFKSVCAEQVYSFFPDVEEIDTDKIVTYPFEQGKVHFFFPASAIFYKEHSTIVEALALLKQNNQKLAEQIQIHFTINKENRPDLWKQIEKYGMESQYVFHGQQSHIVVLQMYKASRALLFPSVIETLGLPMLEAAAFGLPVLVCDLPYAHDVIGNYEGTSFIGAYDYKAWADVIARHTLNEYSFSPLDPQQSNWDKIINLINSSVPAHEK